MTNHSAATNYKLGDRIECAGYYGTIRYIGPIEGKPSIWLGIDWDCPNRGKHDGTVNEHRYFSTSHATSGSFLHPNKVNFGINAYDAIVSRYGVGEDELTARINQQKQLLIKQNMNAPFIEMVGFDKVFNKQKELGCLRIANLREQFVCCAGPVGQLGKTCPIVEELDMSKNLLSSWSEVFRICQQLPKLNWLNVGENLMTLPANCEEFQFPTVKTLICGHMRLTWQDFVTIGNVFPNLEEFRAPYNNITTIIRTENFLPELNLLDLEGNLLRTWSEICKLDCLQNLEQLIVENVALDSIQFEGTEMPVRCFRNLKKLCIVNNLITEWDSINELNRLQSLEHLKISRNPVLELESKETAYQIIIAKIANLKLLNGVEIEANERRGAEIDYTKKYGLDWLKVRGTSARDDFLKSHPRYLEFIEKYGELEESELIKKPSIIKSSLIQLQVTFEDSTLVKKVPPSITIQKLAFLIQKLFNLSDRPRLTYVSSTDANIEIELSDELKDVSVYSMQDGDKIVVKLG